MRLSVLTPAIISFCLWTVVGASDNPPATTTAASQPTLRITGEYGEILGMFKLQGKQRELYLAAVYKRQLALADWDRSPDGRKLNALRTERATTKDNARRNELEKPIQDLATREGLIKVNTRAEILLTLSPEQQTAWFASKILRHTRRPLAPIELSDAQREQLHALALQEAAALLQPDTIQKDPYLTIAKNSAPAFLEKVKAQILTDDQRAKLAPKPTTAPANPPK